VHSSSPAAAAADATATATETSPRQNGGIPGKNPIAGWFISWKILFKKDS